jgi:hypothetical protein
MYYFLNSWGFKKLSFNYRAGSQKQAGKARENWLFLIKVMLLLAYRYRF